MCGSSDARRSKQSRWSAGAFDQTCKDISLLEQGKRLQANCSTTPFEEEDRGWRWTNIYLPDCLSRDWDFVNAANGYVKLST